MFLFCNEDRKKKERLNSVLQTTRNLIKKNDIKDVRKNPVYSLIRAMSNYHLYDIVRELYEDEEVTDVQSIYKDIGEYLINSDKLNNSKSFNLGESNIDIDLSKEDLQKIKHIHIIACGTAMHAGLNGKHIIERLTRIPVNVEVASEFRYKNPILDKEDLAIFISQSGETADTIACLELIKERNIKHVLPLREIQNVGNT